MIDALRCPYTKPFDSIISKRCSVKNIAGAHGVEHILALCVYGNWSDGLSLLRSKCA